MTGTSRRIVTGESRRPKPPLSTVRREGRSKREDEEKTAAPNTEATAKQRQKQRPSREDRIVTPETAS